MMLPADVSSSPLLKQRRSLDIFACMVIVSLLLHLAASVIFVLPGSFSSPGAPPLFVELQNPVESQAPAESLPAKEIENIPQQTPQPEAVPQVPEATSQSVKLEQAVAGSLRRAVQAPEAVHENAIGLGMISGHFASFAEGATLKDDIKVYYFELMRRINEAWWTGGAAQGSFVNAAAVNLTISREGKLLGCELLESSGSREQDRALLAAVKAAEPLPPLPKSYLWPTFNAPIRFSPPLRLMFPGFGGKKSGSSRGNE